MGSSCRIECIFFSEFHPTLGPKITYQVPFTLPGPDEERDALRRLAGCLGPCAASRLTIHSLNGEDTQTQVSGS